MVTDTLANRLQDAFKRQMFTKSIFADNVPGRVAMGNSINEGSFVENKGSFVEQKGSLIQTRTE